MRDRLRRYRRRTNPTGSEAGFTLVEVIVALAMLSAGLSLVLGFISSGPQRAAAAERMAEAGSLAQSLMSEVGTELPIRPEERDGQYPNGYRWHLRIRPFGESKEHEEGLIGLYAVSTELEWGEGAEKRSFVLTTLRLAAKGTRP
jgi:general secretion pathway protein I